MITLVIPVKTGIQFSLFCHCKPHLMPPSVIPAKAGIQSFCHCEPSLARRNNLVFACPPLEGVSRSDGGGICHCEPSLRWRGNLVFSSLIM